MSSKGVLNCARPPMATGVRCPAFVAGSGESIRAEPQRGRDLAGDFFIPLAIAQGVDASGVRAGLLRDLTVAELQAAHRFADDVVEFVFEGNGHGVGAGLDW